MTRFSESQGGAIMADDGSTKGPRVYFDVDDINAGVARVKELGGEASDAHGRSRAWAGSRRARTARAIDFGLWQTDPSASM